MLSETREAKSPNARLPSAIPREAGSRKAIVKDIAKTSESIRQKYRALKTGKMEEDVELERHFKPIIFETTKIPLVWNLIPSH